MKTGSKKVAEEKRISKPKAGRSIRKQSAGYGYLFTAHWVIGFLLFSVFPLFFSLFMSTQKVMVTAKGIEATAVGLDNYLYGLTLDFSFLMAIVESIKSILMITPLIIVLSMMLSIMLNRKIRMRGLFRAIYFLPVIIISGTLMQMLEGGGAFSVIDLDQSSILSFFQQESLKIVYAVIAFLLDHIFTVMWFSGVQILIYMSGLQKNSRATYEAAAIDGASAWQVFWKITLPALNQFTILNVVYTVVLLSTFSTSPVMVSVRESMFGTAAHEGLGYASAQSWLYFALILLVLVLFLLPLNAKGGRKKVKAHE